MKNIIPVVVAVVLGLAGVFVVNRIVSKQSVAPERKVIICAASRMLKANEQITDASIYGREVTVSSLPQQHILYENRSLIIGQKTLHPIAKDDYMLFSNIGTTSHMSNIIGDGEWGCPVKFDDSTLLAELQPGDEIAIVAHYKAKKKNKISKDASAQNVGEDVFIATVLYPRVRILSKLKNGGGVMLSLPPQQAIALTAMKKNVQLYPFLRKPNDPKALNRKDGGVFYHSTDLLNELIDGFDKIEIPLVPSDMKIKK